MISVLIILCLILAGAIAGIVWMTIRLGRANSDKAAAEQRAAVAENTVTQQRQNYEQQLSDQDRRYEQQLAERDRQHEQRVEEVRRSMEDKFKTLASDTLDATVQRHSQQAGQTIETVIAPMRAAFEKLSQEFERRSLDTQTERTVLKEGINTLRQLNMQVSDETRRLTYALRGNTGFQGRWGEMVLENILEGSGLEQSRWVVYQETTTTTEGDRFRPDAVIHCPRGRDIIIDSKVSLKSYLNMTEALSEEDRKTFSEDHLRSVETHLRGLSNKEYQTRVGAGKAGFVLMFIPHEGAYLAAMQANPDLWQRAYDRHVVIVSPTHLVTVVRLVEQMWQTEDQTANSIAIAEEATRMMDQLNDFLNDLVETEKAIDKAHEKVLSAHKRLATGNGNVLRRAEKLKTLGIKTKKDLRLTAEDED